MNHPPTETSLTEHNRIARLIASIQEYIDEAKAICERGEYVALEGLDERVHDITQSINQLSREEAKQHAADLEHMMQSLEDLQNLFEEKRKMLGDEAGGLGRFQRAAKAYTQTDKSTPRDDQKPE